MLGRISYFNHYYRFRKTALLYTVKGERFAGLNIRGFSAIKFFTDMVLWYLD